MLYSTLSFVDFKQSLIQSDDTRLDFIYNDGGRKDAGYKSIVGDCVVRAIAIATNQSYQLTYNAINEFSKREYKSKLKPFRSSSKSGVYKCTYDRYLKHLGWKWIPLMSFTTKTRYKMNRNDIPKGRIIVKTYRHLTAVIDHVIHDLHDYSNNGNRCVHGYYLLTQS